MDCSRCGDPVQVDRNCGSVTCGRCLLMAADKLAPSKAEEDTPDRRIVGSWDRLDLATLRASLGDARTAVMLGLTVGEMDRRVMALDSGLEEGDRPGWLTPDGKPQVELSAKRYRHRKGPGRPVQDHQQAGRRQASHRHGAADIPARNPDWNPARIEPGGEAVYHSRKTGAGTWQTGLRLPSKSECYMQPERCRELVEEWGSKSAAARAIGVAPGTLDSWLSAGAAAA